MKKAFLLLIFTLATIHFAFAQDVKKPLVFIKPSSIDSIVRQQGNLLKLSNGDQEPKVFTNGQIKNYKYLSTVPAKQIIKLTYYSHTKSGPYYGLLADRGPLVVLQLASKPSPSKDGLQGMTNTSAKVPTAKDDNQMVDINTNGPKQQIVPEDNTIYLPTDPGIYVASYAGGMEKLEKYISDNIKYPAEAEAKKIQGTVKLSFVVEKDGSLTDIKPLTTLGYGLEEEAVRLLKYGRRWNPSIKDGKPTRVRLTYDVRFALK